MTEFKLPELGENIAAGDVTRVLVNVGDTVKRDQPVLELETDKATIEVPSSVEGVVRELRVKAGENVKVGQPILLVEADAATAEKPGAAEEAGDSGAAGPEGGGDKPLVSQAAQSAPPTPTDARAPVEGEPDDAEEAEIGAEGGQAQHAPRRRDDTAAPRERARQEREPRGDGEEPAERGKVVDISRAPRPPAAASGPVVPAAPSTRRHARELGLDIAQVPGTGPGGRISAEDVKDYARQVITGAVRARAAGPLPDFERWGEVERQPMRAVRRKTAEHMAEAWATVPHVTQFDKADITALDELRERFSKRTEAAGGRLTVTAIALKVCAAALKRFPQFNSSIDLASDEIILKKYVHIGVAVDTDRGLLVPVIRDVDRKNITQLSAELGELAAKARNRKLSIEEMEGGTFTISNLGGLGGTYFSPIVNVPEVAILGLSRSLREPVWEQDRFEPRLMLPLSLSYDHRVIDGADAVRFLRWIVEALEQPFLLSLQG